MEVERKMLRSERTFKCLDCYRDTLPNEMDFTVHDNVWLQNEMDFTVHDNVWLQAVPGYVGHLCIHCLRIRLQRNLQLSDFVLELEPNKHITQTFLDRINQCLK
jgi:hypothetical protein